MLGTRESIENLKYSKLTFNTITKTYEDHPASLTIFSDKKELVINPDRPGFFAVNIKERLSFVNFLDKYSEKKIQIILKDPCYQLTLEPVL